jgi:hypothetical protein
MLSALLKVLDFIDNRFKKSFLVEGNPIEFVLIATHRFFEAACPTGFIDADYPFIMVDLKKRTDIVWFGEQKTMVAGSKAEILIFEVRFYQHRRRLSSRINRNIEVSTLKHFVFLSHRVNPCLQLLYLLITFAQHIF